MPSEPVQFSNAVTKARAAPIGPACPIGVAPVGGGGGCTWQRAPAVRVRYGTDLLAAGWNKSSSFDDKTGRYKVRPRTRSKPNAKLWRAAVYNLFRGRRRTLHCG